MDGGGMLLHTCIAETPEEPARVNLDCPIQPEGRGAGARWQR